jgi:hypothetical protein
MVRIVHRKLGDNTNHPTLKRFLARYDTPHQLELALPTFATLAEAYQARWTVVRMAAEGWNKKSIADCLKLSRSHVYTILEAFARDGLAGLEEQRTRPPQHPEKQLNLPFLKEVLDLQKAYPRAGRFRSCTSSLRIMFRDLSRPVCAVSISRFSALEICFQPLIQAS